MRKLRPGLVLLALSPLIAVVLGAARCNEPPPCLELPETMVGGFNGVLYNPDSGGQMFANFSDICVNVDTEVTYYANTNDMQTVVIREEVEGFDLYVIFIANFKSPTGWTGGAQILVLVDAALESVETGEPIPMDGYDSVGYFWVDDYWDMAADPDYITASGEMIFDIAVIVPGGPIVADFAGDIVPYDPA